MKSGGRWGVDRVGVCRGLELEGGCVIGNGESGWTSTRGEGHSYQKRAGRQLRPESCGAFEATEHGGPGPKRRREQLK